MPKREDKFSAGSDMKNDETDILGESGRMLGTKDNYLLPFRFGCVLSKRVVQIAVCVCQEWAKVIWIDRDV